MIKWTDRGNLSFEMGFARYEFPDVVEDWDANWILVRFRAAQGKREWYGDCACFLTWDVVSFRRWLQDISADATAHQGDTFSVLEPDIQFSYLGEWDSEYKFDLSLQYGVRPKWFQEEVVILTVGFDQAGLEAAIAYLQETESKLPPRGELGKKHIC